MTDLIYTSYPDLAEGQMARLRASVVNTRALADAARAVGLGAHIRLGKGEQASGGGDKDSLLADTFEAVIGAVYVDRGLDAVRSAVVPIFSERLERSLADIHRFDAKTALQEAVVHSRGEFPSYRLTASGPDHSKHFEARVLIHNELYGQGAGSSKKEAEQNAAREALQRLAAETGIEVAEPSRPRATVASTGPVAEPALTGREGDGDARAS